MPANMEEEAMMARAVNQLPADQEITPTTLPRQQGLRIPGPGIQPIDYSELFPFDPVGNLIAAAIDKVGLDGVVTVEESKSYETTLETVEGMQFERGYKSPYFVTDNSTMQAQLDTPYILLYDGKINAVKELLPILESVSQQNKSLLIIAEDIDGEA